MKTEDTGKRLNREWGVGAKHAQYSWDGTYYNSLREFPGAYFDNHGYVLFKTKREFLNCPIISIGKRVGVRRPGISQLPDYVLVKTDTNVNVSQFHPNTPLAKKTEKARTRAEAEEIERDIEESKQLIKVRQGQSVFRTKVLANFGGRCCLSGIEEPDLLVASHIVPWKDRKDTRLDPRNGLCLFMTYDKLFDQGYFSFTNSLTVIITPRCRSLSKNLQSILKEIEGNQIRYPSHYKIKSEFLKYHRDKRLKR